MEYIKEYYTNLVNEYQSGSSCKLANKDINILVTFFGIKFNPTHKLFEENDNIVQNINTLIKKNISLKRFAYNDNLKSREIYKLLISLINIYYYDNHTILTDNDYLKWINLVNHLDFNISTFKESTDLLYKSKSNIGIEIYNLFKYYISGYYYLYNNKGNNEITKYYIVNNINLLKLENDQFYDNIEPRLLVNESIFNYLNNESFNIKIVLKLLELKKVFSLTKPDPAFKYVLKIEVNKFISLSNDNIHYQYIQLLKMLHLEYFYCIIFI